MYFLHMQLQPNSDQNGTTGVLTFSDCVSPVSEHEKNENMVEDKVEPLPSRIHRPTLRDSLDASYLGLSCLPTYHQHRWQRHRHMPHRPMPCLLGKRGYCAWSAADLLGTFAAAQWWKLSLNKAGYFLGEKWHCGVPLVVWKVYAPRGVL